MRADISSTQTSDSTRRMGNEVKRPLKRRRSRTRTVSHSQHLLRHVLCKSMSSNQDSENIPPPSPGKGDEPPRKRVRVSEPSPQTTPPLSITADQIRISKLQSRVQELEEQAEEQEKKAKKLEKQTKELEEQAEEHKKKAKKLEEQAKEHEKREQLLLSQMDALERRLRATQRDRSMPEGMPSFSLSGAEGTPDPQPTVSPSGHPSPSRLSGPEQLESLEETPAPRPVYTSGDLSPVRQGNFSDPEEGSSDVSSEDDKLDSSFIIDEEQEEEGEHQTDINRGCNGGCHHITNPNVCGRGRPVDRTVVFLRDIAECCVDCRRKLRFPEE